MVLSNGKEVKQLNCTEYGASLDKRTFQMWCEGILTTEEAVYIFNKNNKTDLTEEEFIEFAEWLGWRYGELN